MKVLKQNVGVEVDAKKLKLNFQHLLDDFSSKIKGTRTFDNTPTGLLKLHTWVEKKRIAELDLHVTMEATGVYYERLAYFLYEETDYLVHVVLPNTSKAFMKSLNHKSKNDALDAKGLGLMGLQRKLRVWEPHSLQMRILKKLARERSMLVSNKTMALNQLHAENSSHSPKQSKVDRLEKRISFLEIQILAVEQEQKEEVAKDPALKERIDNICTSPGLAFTSVASVIAELNGFALIENRAQLTSYVGLDVVSNESGSSKKGKQTISKKGNSHVRRILYMPALSAIRHDPHHKAYRNRIVNKTNIKNKGVVAIQRKLLLQIYSMFKNNIPFDPQHRVRLKEKVTKTKSVKVGEELTVTA